MIYHILSLENIKELMDKKYITSDGYFTSLTYSKSKFEMREHDQWGLGFFNRHNGQTVIGKKYDKTTKARDYVYSGEFSVCFIDTVEFWDYILNNKNCFKEISL